LDTGILPEPKDRGAVLRREARRFLCSRLVGDHLPLRLIFWDGDAFDAAPEPRVVVTFGSPRVLNALVGGNFNELAKAYVEGDLAIDGTIDEVVQTGAALAERLDNSPIVRFLNRLAAILRIRSRRTDAAAERYYYDAPNEFYRLWLDERMMYSCAYFRTGDEDIDVAQTQKLEHVCRKLLLAPGDRLLDIGCGWGGLLHWAAQKHNVSGLGVTLSELQHAYARERLAGGRIEVRLQDYRDIGEGVFDKIVSVDMCEYDGPHGLPAYLRKVSTLLRPGGAFLNQGIVTNDHRSGRIGAGGGGFVKCLFPGGAVSHLSRMISEIAEAGLEVVDVEDLRPHYARTLIEWSRRLDARSDEAIKAAGVERYRIWRIYLAGMAHAFELGWLSVAQVLAYKPAKEALASRPWTREYQYNGDMNPPRTGAARKNANAASRDLSGS
jgi:cyclopropane-fatty-acyl-phospholipid synthase